MNKFLINLAAALVLSVSTQAKELTRKEVKTEYQKFLKYIGAPKGTSVVLLEGENADANAESKKCRIYVDHNRRFLQDFAYPSSTSYFRKLNLASANNVGSVKVIKTKKGLKVKGVTRTYGRRGVVTASWSDREKLTIVGLNKSKRTIKKLKYRVGRGVNVNVAVIPLANFLSKSIKCKNLKIKF